LVTFISIFQGHVTLTFCPEYIKCWDLNLQLVGCESPASAKALSLKFVLMFKFIVILFGKNCVTVTSNIVIILYEKKSLFFPKCEQLCIEEEVQKLNCNLLVNLKSSFQTISSQICQKYV
jgi:hypothetical protein